MKEKIIAGIFVAESVAMIISGCGKSPTDSAQERSEIGLRTAAPSDTVTIRPNRIGVIKESFRLESESGDSTLVFGTFDDPKYVTIHFKLTPWSDINTLDSLEVSLYGFQRPSVRGVEGYAGLLKEDGIVNISFLFHKFKNDPWSNDISVKFPLVTHPNTTAGTWNVNLDIWVYTVGTYPYSWGGQSEKTAAAFTIPDFEGAFAPQPVPTDESPAIVTNVAGGKVLAVGIPEDPKYAIVRFKHPNGENGWSYLPGVSGRTENLDAASRRAFAAVEDSLCISVNVNNLVFVSDHIVCVERHEWEDGIVAVPLVNTYPTGKMRDGREGWVELFKPGSKARWRSPRFADETTVYSPLPTRLVLHPVAIDHFTKENETRWLEAAVVETIETLRGAASHMPIAVHDFVVGPAIEIKNERVGDDIHQWAKETGYENGLFHTAASPLDLHVVVIRSEVSRGYPIGGVAGTGSRVPTMIYGGGEGSFELNGILWHELGHALGMGHTPCGPVTGIEGRYPHADGFINMDAYEVAADRTLTVKPREEYHDIMSYCSPTWISAYTYRKIAEYHLGIEPTGLPVRVVVPDPATSSPY